MKRFVYCILLIIIFIICLSFSAYASKDVDIENCHTMTEEWFGNNVNLFSQNELQEIINQYFDIRETSLISNGRITFSKLSHDVLNLETLRRERLIEMQERMNIRITDVESHISIGDVKQVDGESVVRVREWFFYDYDDLDVAGYAVNVSGFGVEHELIIDSDNCIINDKYDESDLTGICTITVNNSDSEELSLLSADDKLSLFGTMYSGYNPDAAATYADKYTYKYNSDYYNFNSIGGDCANFTSQSIYAGGMPQVVGTAYGTDGWYYKTSSNRSATWTGASSLRTWMANNRGNLVNSPSASQIYKGSPVFYDWYNDGSWDHATICVGTNLEGTPIIDSHNSDKYHHKWNYGYSNTKHSTVQLTNGNLKTPTSATLSTDKEWYAGGETFTLRFASDTSCQYYLSIFDYNTGEAVIQTDVNGSIYSNSFQRAGHYHAYMSAFNSKGSVDSNWVDFYIYVGGPSSARISPSKTELSLGESITFSNSHNAYYAWTYMTIYNEDTKTIVDEGWKPLSYTFKPTKNAVYKALMSAYTPASTAHAESVYFYVGKYTVSYNANGGSGAPSSQTKIYGKTLTLSNTKPKRTGYTFKNWNTKSGGTGTSYVSGGSYTANAAATLYAQWTSNSYKVTFNANGGTTPTTSKNVTYNSTYGTLPTPTREGYLFKGWYTSANGGSQVTSSTKVAITSAQTLYARWTPNTYTLTYDIYGGEGEVRKVTYQYGDKVCISDVVPIRFGYICNGWSTEKDDFAIDYIPNYEYEINADITLYPVWTMRQYTVIYGVADGVGDIAPETYNYFEEALITGITPTREGYRFAGWSEEKDDWVIDYIPNHYYAINADVTLYPVWYPLPYIDAVITEYSSYMMCDVELFNINESECVIIFGKYNNGELISAEIRPYKQENEIYPIFEDVDMVKIIAVESTTNLKPVCKIKTLEIY